MEGRNPVDYYSISPLSGQRTLPPPVCGFSFIRYRRREGEFLNRLRRTASLTPGSNGILGSDIPENEDGVACASGLNGKIDKSKRNDNPPPPTLSRTRTATTQVEQYEVIVEADIADESITEQIIINEVITEQVITKAVMTKEIITEADIADEVITEENLTRANLRAATNADRAKSILDPFNANSAGRNSGPFLNNKILDTWLNSIGFPEQSRV
ncbi:hypothetical protein NHQ30_000971 [Ciborinia camelliae]|nr:hypothetical protein NHQ30_000971 [Ciborinia camelliae]